MCRAVRPGVIALSEPVVDGDLWLIGLLVIDLPAFDVKQVGDLAIAISAVLLRKPDQCQPQRIIISRGRSI